VCNRGDNSMPATALIVIDVQNAFCHPEGSFRKRGYELLEVERVIEAIQKLLCLARKLGWLVVFTKTQFRSDYSNAGLLVRQIAPEIAQLKGYQEGSWDAELIPQLTPQSGEVIITKTRYDPFVDTYIEQILKRHGVNQIVVCGLLTNVCVESCVRSAFDRDFKVILAADAVTTYSSELHAASLKTIEHHFGTVKTTNEIEARFGRDENEYQHI